MRRLWLAALAASMVVPVAAQSQTVLRPHRAQVSRLPPVAGVIKVRPGATQQGGRTVVLHRSATPHPQIVFGTPWGGQGVGPTYRYRALTPAEQWATGGTGLRGLIGNTGNPFAGQARWGTADSATSGPGYGSGWVDGGEPPLVERYGEPAIFPTTYDVPAYGAAPQLGYYGSGRPSTMAYYSSGSSAGPYGSPGGLATYRSGSYGYGPRIITIPGGGRLSQGCSCGPRIIRLGRHHHAVVID
jgi:hypothetical protein